MANLLLRVDSKATYPNEPSGFTALIGRNFSSMAAAPNDRGVGSFPYKITGSEGWDDVERNGAQPGDPTTNCFSIEQDLTEPDAVGGLYRSGVMRITYNGVLTANGPGGVIQTLDMGPTVGMYPQQLYMRLTLRLGPNYQVGGVTNKLIFHRSTDDVTESRAEPFLLLQNNGDNTFKLGVNFQGTPDNNLGHFFATTGPALAIARETWYTIETLLINNTTATQGEGEGDGTFKCWVNGVLGINKVNEVAYLREAGQTWNTIHISPTCGSCSTLSQPFYFDYGSIYVSGKATL